MRHILAPIVFQWFVNEMLITGGNYSNSDQPLPLPLMLQHFTLQNFDFWTKL